jgi:hypothetical protein
MSSLKYKPRFAIICLVVLLALTARGAEPKNPTIVDEHLASTVLRENRIGLDPNRLVKVVLPPGYAESSRCYPVVYYLHSFFWSPQKMFEDGSRARLLERGWNAGVVQEFILVAADFSGPTTGSMYENSPVSGRWLDFIVHELVPFIDGKFRTLARRESRAVVGDFFGGRGALELAMTHAETFAVAYALHPVATGMGSIPWSELGIDWLRLLTAKSLDEVGPDGRTRLFLAISQAFLPNLARPPFYCDFFKEMKDGVPTLNVEHTLALKRAFMLEDRLTEAAPKLRTMRGLALDWGAFDPTQDHVYANRQFSRTLEDLNVEHEAEEYNGDPSSKVWTEHGRFYERVLPFLNRSLVFE